MIFFNIFFNKELSDGPMWRKLAETEEINCWKNYWTNFLFLNNIIAVTEPVNFLRKLLNKLKLFNFAVLTTNLVCGC